MSEGQTIFRVHREDRDKFALIGNATIRDNRLSFKATGLLCYLLSLPGDWQVSQNHLATVKTDGRDSVIAGFRELQEAGYVKKVYDRNAAGQIETTVWHVFETPKSDFPISGKPKSVEPISGKPTLQRTTAEEDGNKSKRKSSSKSKIQIPDKLDTPEFVTAWDAWNAYRKEARLRAYVPRGAQAQLSILAVLGVERAIAAINHSIAQGFHGIYEPKHENKTNGTNSSAGHNGGRNAGTFNAGRQDAFAGVERLAGTSQA